METDNIVGTIVEGATGFFIVGAAFVGVCTTGAGTGAGAGTSAGAGTGAGTGAGAGAFAAAAIVEGAFVLIAFGVGTLTWAESSPGGAVGAGTTVKVLLEGGTFGSTEPITEDSDGRTGFDTSLDLPACVLSVFDWSSSFRYVNANIPPPTKEKAIRVQIKATLKSTINLRSRRRNL